MKIVFFRHSLLSRGGDKMIVIHANHLVSKGHRVCIVTSILDTVFYIDPRVSINKLASESKFATIFAAIVNKNDSDLIIADIIPMACFLYLSNNKKVVYFAQDYDESYYKSSLLKTLIRFFYFVGLKLLSMPTIAVSYPLADVLKKKFNANVLVAENGVDTKVFYVDPDLELVGMKQNRKAILLLSRSDQRKGFDTAQKVIKIISKNYSDLFEVWTVGEKCTGLFGDVIHHDFGYVDENTLRKIMSSADIFLYPTRHEGFGLMPLEAMACACTVVTTEAVPFVINGDNALVSMIDDSEDLIKNLKLLFDDKLLSNQLIESGKKLANKFTLLNATNKFEIALKSMLKNG